MGKYNTTLWNCHAIPGLSPRSKIKFLETNPQLEDGCQHICSPLGCQLSSVIAENLTYQLLQFLKDSQAYP
jgi:hypothetical protein